ncbi:DUF2306 domain-containing protein [Amycolatopsis sp. NPDC024027]|uniref:DUF2306 domain-containing protein n=1 Tax=Amycolatopsis sp. NPDC024027 TaxID=3154327 RepID=UPI0033BFC665
MTQHSDVLDRVPEPEPEKPPGPRRGPGRPWYRRTWVAPAALISIAFIAYSLPPYLSFDPAQARIPGLRRDVPWHFALLEAHILFGTVALATVPFQIWPRLRVRRPALHRTIGRVYVFGGVIPSGILALFIVPFSAGPPGNAIAALLWLGCTVTGFVMARRRNWVEHRRWMIFSFALCMQIVWGRVILLTLRVVPGYDMISMPLVLETATWIGFVINLTIAYWWLERTKTRPLATRKV